MPEIKLNDLQEVKNIVQDGFRKIIPEHGMSIKDAKNYWKDVFSGKIEQNLDGLVKDYFDDIRNRSECPDTLSKTPFKASELRLRTPEENAKMHEEFDDLKRDMKKQWEKENNRAWPKYDHDVYSSNGKLIRKKGDDYDAHHIKPLGMGGENVASNITPLSAEVHYDKQGVHSPDSPYSRINKVLGGNVNDL